MTIKRWQFNNSGKKSYEILTTVHLCFHTEHVSLSTNTPHTLQHRNTSLVPNTD